MMSTAIRSRTEPAAASERPARSLRRVLADADQPFVLYGAFVVLIVGFTLASPVFFSAANFSNIARQTALVSIIAVGMAFVIITAEIDLSVASNLALSGVVAAMVMRDLASVWWLGSLAGLLCGLVVGLLNGVLVAYLRIPSFLVTLGMLGAARGTALLLSGTAPVLVTDVTYWNVFHDGALASISTPILWTLAVIAVGVLVLHYGTFGRKLLATGGNPRAARYSGIDTRRVKLVAFAFTGALAGLAGLILAARGHAARPDVAAGLELDVIAAVILGGTSLFGGRGTIFGVVLGGLIIGILNNGLVLLGVAPSVQLIIKGAIIVAAVAFNGRSGAR